MVAQTDLSTLLKTMNPELHPAEFVFCSVSPDLFVHLTVEFVGCFREVEGVTLIVERETADEAGLEYGFVGRMITLTVHSSLEAVGFLAAITAKLAAAGISVNPVSAFYHDHLFVPAEQAELAMQLLHELVRSAG